MILISRYDFLLENMRWSFSRLNLFHTCKRAWYNKYILCDYGISNMYSEFGSFCHEILEKYLKDELTKKELSEYFEEYFADNVTSIQLSKIDIYNKLFESGYDYFKNIDLNLKDFTTLGVEQKCDFKINDFKFTGFIDLLSQNNNTNKLYLIDHKSATFPFNLNGTVKKQNAKKFEEYKTQLYLYSAQVKKDYGKFPDYLCWNFFKSQKWKKISFNENEYDNAIKWAEETLSEIYKEEEFLPNIDFYFCNYICEYRNTCEFK